jgi:hypothetical protein
MQYEIRVLDGEILVASADVRILPEFEGRWTWKWISGAWKDLLDQADFFTRGIMFDPDEKNESTIPFFGRDTMGAENGIDCAMCVIKTLAPITVGQVGAVIGWTSGTQFIEHAPTYYTLEITEVA